MKRLLGEAVSFARRAGVAKAANRFGLTPAGISTRVAPKPTPAGKPPLNRLAHPDAWEDPEWLMFNRTLGMPQGDQKLHRKAFEWTQCVYGLERLGALGAGKTALGVGAGHECVLYYLANRTDLTIATDLYEGSFIETPAAEAAPDFLWDHGKYAPFEYERSHLAALPANGCELPFANDSFDVAYSLSSIEHFGSHANAGLAMREMARVLKPGGILCVATEYILEGGAHHEYFTPQEFDEFVIKASGLALVEPFDTTPPPRGLIDDPTLIPRDIDRRPHLVLGLGPLRWTSAILFFRKLPAAELVKEGVKLFAGRAAKKLGVRA